jgi:hypothetical protein
VPSYAVDEPRPPVDAILIDSDEDIAGGSR